MVIYAATPGSLIYHLVVAKHHRTLCGLYVVGDLYLIADPEDRILCKHCERIDEERGEKK